MNAAMSARRAINLQLAGNDQNDKMYKNTE